MLLVGDDKGRVCIYRSGSLINVKTVFSSPVVSLQESEEVVMLSTYSAIVIWSKTTVLDIIANQNIEEMQVRIKFVLELYPKFLSEKFLSIDGSFIVREKKQKVLSYKIGFFLVKLKCWSSKCWNYFLYNFTENCVSSSHYSVTVMWTGSDIRTRRWQNQYLWLLCSLSLSGGLQTTFRTITLKKTKWFRSWFNKCWLKGWRVLHKYLTRFSLKFRLFTFVKFLQNCTTTIPSCLINLMALTRSDKWKRITILNFRIHC